MVPCSSRILCQLLLPPDTGSNSSWWADLRRSAVQVLALCPFPLPQPRTHAQNRGGERKRMFWESPPILRLLWNLFSFLCPYLPLSFLSSPCSLIHSFTQSIIHSSRGHVSRGVCPCLGENLVQAGIRASVNDSQGVRGQEKAANENQTFLCIKENYQQWCCINTIKSTSNKNKNDCYNYFIFSTVNKIKIIYSHGLDFFPIYLDLRYIELSYSYSSLLI